MEQKSVRGPAMRDVAQAAGVSAQTVSRVLSDHPHVQESTRQRVLAVVEELGYRRNNTARALVTGQSRTLGVLTQATNNYSRSSLALGVELGAREAHYAVNSVTSSLDADSLTDAVSRLVHQGVDGIIFATPLAEAGDAVRRLTQRIPTVHTDGSSQEFDGLVGVNQDHAAALATAHLLDLGHETVWHLAGPGTWSESAIRIESWRRTLREAGRDCPPVLYGDWSPESGYRQGLTLAADPHVTAVLAASDEMAFGLIRALTEHGRRVPQDVSVVGIDDIDLAAYANPPLTTVRQSFIETGRRAVADLVARIAHPESPSPARVAEPTLIVRASTAPPPAA